MFDKSNYGGYLIIHLVDYLQIEKQLKQFAKKICKCHVIKPGFLTAALIKVYLFPILIVVRLEIAVLFVLPSILRTLVQLIVPLLDFRLIVRLVMHLSMQPL